MRLVLATALALVVAGCLGATPSDPTPSEAEEPAPAAFLDPIIDQHNHGDPLEHMFRTGSMVELGWHPLGDDGEPFTYIGEVDWQGDHVYVAVIGRGSMPGFVIVNASDPAAPEVVGRAEMPNAYVVDVKVDDMGEYVYAASQRATSAAQPGSLEDAFGRIAIWVWDVRDKTNPKLVSQTPVPGTGCHMLAYWKHDDFRAGIHGLPLPQRHVVETIACVSETIHFYETFLDPAGAKRLHLVSQYSPQSTAGLDETIASREVSPGPTPHDMTFQWDPVDGRALLFVSYWDLGLRVVDVTNVMVPIEIGTWTGDGATHYVGNVHSAMATVIDGRRIVVVGPELLGDTIPSLVFLDATDYGGMTLLGEWWAPGEHTAQGLLLTTHQFQLVDGRVYLAYNHAGVWVLDIRTILAGDYRLDPTRPEVLGYHLERRDVLGPDNEFSVPGTWDLVVREGVIWASDRYTGLYALHYTPDALGDPALVSFA